MFDGPIRTGTLCPACGEDLWRKSAREQVCRACNEPVRVTWAYRRQIAYESLLAVALIGIATYKQTSAGPWIIGLVFLWGLIAFALRGVRPATYERGYAQVTITFVGAFLGMFVSLFVVEFVGFLAAGVLVGANRAEIQEHLEMMSLPLAWLSPQFLITPRKSFLDVCGIMLGNSFLIGIPLFLCVKFTQHVLRRGCVVQIGIDHSVDDDKD